MIKLIDPKRQAEIEDIIVDLQSQVSYLSLEVRRLHEESRRNQIDIGKVSMEVGKKADRGRFLGGTEPYKDVASVWEYPRVTQEDVFDDL